MRVAHFGTFDVDNYGDLLFPHVAEWRLPDWSIVHVSPTDAQPSFADSRPTISASRASQQEFAYFIVGGGNIVNSQVTSLAPYREVSRLAYASLWLGAAKQASEAGRPLAFNGPGVSQVKPGNIERRLLRDVVRAAAYAAFRDEESVRNVRDAEAVLIPDTAFDIGRMWPLADDAAPAPRGSIAVHVNRRYVRSIAATAAVLDELADRLRGPIRLVPIGPCHGDVETAQGVAAAMRTPVRVEAVTTLREMARAIACSERYIGSSMHGFITSLAYGRRATLVLNERPMHKFQGVLASAGLRQSAILPAWEALSRADDIGVSLGPEARGEIYASLDRHWDRLRLAAEQPGVEVSRVVDNWRLVVPLAQLESIAQKAAAKLTRYLERPSS